MSKAIPIKSEPVGSCVVLWGGVLRPVAGLITDIIALRISARSVDAYANQHETGRQVFNEHPDARFLDDLPDNLFEKGHNGDIVRRLHGVVPISPDSSRVRVID